MSQNPVLDLCLQHIEQLLKWGESSQWTNQDFEKLSERIFEKTKVRLSVSTLKRVWGKVRYDSNPTLSTRNALALFLDFPAWRDFERAHESGGISGSSMPSATTPVIPSPGTSSFSDPRKLRAVVGMSAAMGLILIAGLLLLSGKGHPDAVYQFKAHKITDGIPNSVVFDYDIPNGKGKDAFIQQSWDPEKRKKIDPAGHQHTSLYYRPGYFHAKLIVDNKIVKEDIVFIKSNGWMGMAELKPTPIYFSAVETRLDEGLGISPESLKEKIGSPVFNDKWISFSNVQEFDKLSGLDFSLKTSVRNTSTVEKSACRRITIFILGTESAILIPLSAKGCISDLGIGTGFGYISGKEKDLSGLGCTYEKLENIQCTVHNGELAILHNNALVTKEKIQQSIGQIAGVRIAFEGAGVIGDVVLADATRTFIDDHFTPIPGKVQARQ